MNYKFFAAFIIFFYSCGGPSACDCAEKTISIKSEFFKNPEMSDDEKINNDYDYSRDTLYELIEKGKDALENMIEVARESEHPRAYEVLSGLIKNVADVNDKLQDLNKKQKQLNDEEKPQVENQQNNYYLGSTSDIQKMLREDNVIDVEAERVISREP